jgi:uncharacterized protein
MTERFTHKEKESLPALLILLGIVLLALVISNMLGGSVMIFMNHLKLSDLGDLNGSIMNAKNGWWSLIIAQGIASFFTFIFAGYIYIKWVEVKELSFLNFEKIPHFFTFILVFLAQLSFSPINGYFQSLNENMKFPAFLKGLETTLKNMEESMADMVGFLTVFDSPLKLIVAIIVIAVFAGIGEELIFRGLVQRKLMQAFNNPHAAIWVAAILFSAIHMQFYGFLPRMFLGAVLGYFYYWSGNIWVPIAGHIFNNTVAIVLVHMVKIKAINSDIEKLDNVPMPALAASVLVFAGLMYLIYKRTLGLKESKL